MLNQPQWQMKQTAGPLWLFPLSFVSNNEFVKYYLCHRDLWAQHQVLKCSPEHPVHLVEKRAVVSDGAVSWTWFALFVLDNALQLCSYVAGVAAVPELLYQALLNALPRAAELLKVQICPYTKEKKHMFQNLTCSTMKQVIIFGLFTLEIKKLKNSREYLHIVNLSIYHPHYTIHVVE